MPPLASSDSTESNEGLGFEIEAEASENGNLVVSNIVCLAPEEQDDDEAELQLVSSSSDDEPIVLPTIDEDKEEEGGLFYSMLDNAISAVTCGYDDDFAVCKPLKSALKDPSRVPVPVDRNVSFTQLQIREYDMTLGDHPSAISGPPVQLDWSFAQESIQDLDDYEQNRQPRRKRKQLRLSYRDRERVLFDDKGFTPDQVNQAWLEALIVRKQRTETLKQSETLTMMEEVWESTQRKVNRLFSV